MKKGTAYKKTLFKLDPCNDHLLFSININVYNF